MIKLSELNPNGYPTDDETRDNLHDYWLKINEVRKHYGKPMYCNSGLRSMADHKRIYEEKNAKLRAEGKPELKIPMGSKHLYGQAADWRDRDGSFWKWCMDNMYLFVKLGLYFEDNAYTKGWVHLQAVPPRSGKRIFKP